MVKRIGNTLVLLAAFYVAAMWLKCRLYDGNPSALIGFGCRTSQSCWSAQNQSSLPNRPVVFRSGGYDGQYFYYLGRELYGGPHAVLDSSPFRRSRVGLSVMAGPLLATGNVGRVYGIPATLLALHLASVGLLSRRREQQRWSVWLFALNPFSLISFLLCTADGAALSLAVMGALLLRPRGGLPTLAARIGGALLLAAALLTKETAIVIAASLGGAWLLDTKQSLRSRLGLAALAGATALPMFLWWRRVGFSVGLAAEHGALPFVGMFRYLPHADLTQAVLAVVLALALAAGVSLVTTRESRAAGLVLLGTAALVSTATAHEYWAAAANVGRLFTPMAAAPALLGDELALLSGAAVWRRRMGLAWAASLIAVTIVVLLREATRKPLPYFVAGAGVSVQK